MSIPRTGNPKWRLHPGEILREEFLKPLNMKPAQLANELRVSAPTINDIVREKRSISAQMAVLLARFFATTEQFWLNVQTAYDVNRAKTQKRLLRKVKAIKLYVTKTAV